MKFVEVLKECEAAGGAGTKKAIQAALAKLDVDGRRLMAYAMDPYTVFGVKKFERPAGFASEDPADIEFFFEMLDKLAKREITGDAARAIVRASLSFFTEETASYLERVIDKDPRAGFSADTFNKVWKEEKIPTFEVMLADKCEDTEDFEKYITFPCQADFKYDGQRTIAIVKEGFPVEYRARSGKESEHLNGLFDLELLALREIVGYDFIMDGEAFASDFTETINAKKAGNDAAKNNLKLRAFFMMPLTEWIAQKTDITMKQNRENLIELLTKVESALHIQHMTLGDEGKKPVIKVILSEGKIVNNYHEMMEYCNEAIDIHKQEGLILKELEAVYTWDRSFSWCKVKRFYDVDARIVGFYPGRPKSRLENTVGGVNCVAFLESGERVEFNVGSGFNDDDREDMRVNPEKWLKATVVIKYQDVSRSKSKTVASLRFCTFEHIRDDKLVEI
jgi:DNA ligase-1